MSALVTAWWTLWQWLRHPVDTFWWNWKWWHRPRPGDYVRDCRGQVHQVIAFVGTDDDLILDDKSHCSWLHCRERARRA